MGKRIHVATKYDVRYSVNEYGFNYGSENFGNLMSLLDVPYTCVTNESGEDVRMEVSASFLKKAIEDMKKGMDTWENQEDVPEIDEIIEAQGLTREGMIELLERIVRDADPKNTWIHICWY